MTVRIAVVLLLALAWSAPPAAGTSEYEVKAAYLYNFAKFVEWPGPQPLSSLTICIYGRDPFGGFLDEVVRGKQVSGAPVAVRRLHAGTDHWDGCQVLFVAAESAARTSALLRRLQGHSTLTVGDSPEFAERGGMIGLVADGDRIRFDVNAAAIAAAHLQVSSRLMALGHLVGEKK